MTRMLTAACVAALAGTALAQPQVLIAEEEWFWNTDVDAGLQQGPPRTGAFGDDVALIGMPGSYGGDFEVAAGDLGPSVNAVSAGLDIATSYDANVGLSIQTASYASIDMASAFDPESPTSGQDYSEARSRVTGRIVVRLTEDATVRFRVEGSTSLTNIGNDEIRHRLRLFAGSPSLPGLEIGTEDSATAMPPFDQTLDLLAGDYIFQFANGFDDDTFEYPEGFDYRGDLDFSFEIVPAPGAAALFGLGGFAAVRRQR